MERNNEYKMFYSVLFRARKFFLTFLAIYATIPKVLRKQANTAVDSRCR